MPAPPPPPFPRATAVVGWSFDATQGVHGIAVVLHVTHVPSRRGPIVERLSEAYRNVPDSASVAFTTLRALEVARAHAAATVIVAGSIPRHQRGAIAPSLFENDSTPAPLALRIAQLAQTFAVARTRWILRSKTLEPRMLARHAIAHHRPLMLTTYFPEDAVVPVRRTPIFDPAAYADDEFDATGADGEESLVESDDDAMDIPF